LEERGEQRKADQQQQGFTATANSLIAAETARRIGGVSP
jgi:hypothetical protein